MVGKHLVSTVILVVLVALGITLATLRSCPDEGLVGERQVGLGPVPPASGPSTILVRGTGQDLYTVYDAGSEKVDFASTGSGISLPAGTYHVELHGIRREVSAEPEEETVLESGTVLVSGTGIDLYSVYDSSGSRKLEFTATGKEIELFPGTYVVALQNLPRTAKIEAGKKTTLDTGVLEVVSDGGGLYSVYDSSGSRKLDFRGTGRRMELLPGTYVVRIDEEPYMVEVKAKETTTISP